MKKACSAFFAFLLFFCVGVLSAHALGGEDLYSGTAVLMDGETGQVLFDKQMRAKVYPASTTKIMTALLVLESCGVDEILTVSASAVAIDEWDSANIGLSVGEQLSVEDALYALMLPSANDAANALAEHVAGTQEAFVGRMNEKARQLGALETSFANAHGLDDDNHYTTAYDMALITAYAAKNRDFLRYFGESDHTIAPTNLQPVERRLRNYQYMLLPDSAFFDPVVTGGKVGFTNAAMHTMSTLADKYGRTLVCVVMRSGRDEKFYDTKALLRHGFEDFHPASLPAGFFSGVELPLTQNGEEAGTVELYSETAFRFLLRNDLFLEDAFADYQLPRSYEAGELSPVSVPVRLQTENGATYLLGTQTLTPRIRAEGAAAPSWLAYPAEKTEGTGSRLMLGVCILGAMVLILAVRIAVSIHRGRVAEREKRRRQARQERDGRRTSYPAYSGGKRSRLS